MENFNFYSKHQMQQRGLSEEIAIEISAISRTFEQAELIYSPAVKTGSFVRVTDTSIERSNDSVIEFAFERTESNELVWGGTIINRADYI